MFNKAQIAAGFMDWHIAQLLGYSVDMITEKSAYLVKGNDYLIVVPKYSTNINDAIGLWDYIDEDYTPRLVRVIQPDGTKKEYAYKASIIPNDGNGAEFEAIAETPSQAICYAFMEYSEKLKRV